MVLTVQILRWTVVTKSVSMRAHLQSVCLKYFISWSVRLMPQYIYMYVFLEPAGSFALCGTGCSDIVRTGRCKTCT